MVQLRSLGVDRPTVITVPDGAPAPGSDEHVVLLDRLGQPIGTRPKRTVHTATTPLHLAFSCHVVRDDGAVLLTRRALGKPTWPGVWTNACCGHPQLGESLREATIRRLGEELGLTPQRLSLSIPDFVYRAEMAAGLVEHELCPVLVACVDQDPRPNDDEVDEFEWVPWAHLLERLAERPDSLSPWSVWQLRELLDMGWSPQRWLTSRDSAALAAPMDRPNTAPASVRWSTPGHAALDLVGREVEPLLARVLAEKSHVLTGIDPALAELADEIRSLVLAGGKRLRPAFVYWGHRATGAPHDHGAIHVAAAIELLHTFALLHDDVMDRSEHRRGLRTAHRSLAALHRGAGRLGDSDWFGTSAAVLAGDLTFVWADEVLGAAPLAGTAADRCRTVFDELRTEVLAGQYLDLVHAAEPRAAESAASKVALLKSARYTVTRPLQLGLSLASPELVRPGLADALGVYGDAVGLAFQLRDDVLGLFGDPATTGKSDFDDLREGKRTMLIVRAHRLATATQCAVLSRDVGNPDLDEAGADRVRDIVSGTGALASIEALLEAKHAVALDALSLVDDSARAALADLATLAIDRQA